MTDRERMERIDELDAAHANLNAGLEEDGTVRDRAEEPEEEED